MEHPRLNKYLATLLGIGRRQVDELIEKGKVTVNGIPARMGQRVAPAEEIEINGKNVSSGAALQYIYLALNKPVGYVCSRRQQGDTPTIYSLLPAKYQHLKPVGRLDKDSSGLLLLTNDGDFALRMTHPRFAKRKMYEVKLSAPLQPLHHQMINDLGIDLPDGKSKLQLERLRPDNDLGWRVQMHEGRNRQIRRTFAALGYKVTRLHRTAQGRYSVADLRPGAYEVIVSDNENLGATPNVR